MISWVSRNFTRIMSNKEKIIIYFDSCNGQNRNIKTVLSLLKLVQTTKIRAELIEMKFLIISHTKEKIQNIYSPNNWCNIIKTCKK